MCDESILSPRLFYSYLEYYWMWLSLEIFPDLVENC